MNMPLVLGRLGILELLCFGKIIDIGCGLGTTFGNKAVNLDKYPNEQLIEYVKKTDPRYYETFLKMYPDGKTMNYIQADATKHIPFDDKYFDCAVLSEVLEHLNDEETKAILKEAGRVADFIIITVPNEYEWPENIQFNKNVQQEENKHLTFHTQETIIRAVTEAGLIVLCYMKLNMLAISHHILVASSVPVISVVKHNGENTVTDMPNLDEIMSFIPLKKVREYQKKLNTQ